MLLQSSIKRLIRSEARSLQALLMERKVTCLLQTYADAQYDYVRSVDVHSHWIGLAMLLIVFGVVFDRFSFPESRGMLLALMLVVGSVTFPLGVLLQTLDRGFLPQAVAAFGAGLVIIALSFASNERD